MKSYYAVIPMGGGGGGYYDIFIHVYVGSGHFFWGGGQNFEFQYFWGFQKNKYFLGYEDVVDIFWGHHKIRLYLGVISMHFMVFSSVHGTECGIFFGVVKISNIFWACLKFLIFFWGKG